MALTWGIPLEAPLASTTEDFLRQTVGYWRNWIKSCKIKDIWQDEVIRSVLVLKIHQADDTGAIIASSTTSLSEHDQSTRNWDYRFCWMRDAYYTLKALNLIGHFTELERYANYIHNIAARYQKNYNPVYSTEPTILRKKSLTSTATSTTSLCGLATRPKSIFRTMCMVRF